MRIVFFGTPSIALPILDKLNKQHEVLAVVTSPDAPVGRKQVLSPSAVALWAEQQEITTIKPQAVKNNPELLEELKNLNADIFIVVAYGKILPLEIINLPRLKTLNVHFSLLPKYRGASPIQGALLAGERETGTSIFILEAGMDTGPILGQQKMTIEPLDDFMSLSDKLAHVSAELMLYLLPRYDQGELSPKPQEDSQASYTKIITKADGRIDWTQSASQIFNQFRAYKHWPGIWTEWKGQKLKVLDCEPLESQDCSALGTINNKVVCCGNQTGLLLKQVQLAGSTSQSIEQFLHGHPDFKELK